MNRIKAFIVIGLVGLALLILNACCDKGFYYKWHSIILQQYFNGAPTIETSINQHDFSLRVHLISSKSDETFVFFPKLIDNAYAYDCTGKYTNIDRIEDIDVILLSNENGLEVQNVVTYLFKAALDSDLGNKMEVFDLPAVLNNESSNPVEYFDLSLKENYDEEINGKLILLMTLSDDRALSDTTATLTLKL